MAVADPIKSARKPNRALQDLTGQVFHRLTVVEYAGRSTDGRILWRCNCECGAKGVVAVAKRLKNGQVKSCGCLMRETRGASSVTHGRSRTAEHRIWCGIITRCTNTGRNESRNYVSRGIGICERWRKSFTAFLEDMGPRPSPKHSVERIDNDREYCPDNCKWATRDVQSRNTRRTKLITHDGVTLCMKDWAKRIGMRYGTLYHYLTHGKTLQEVIAAYDQPSTEG